MKPGNRLSRLGRISAIITCVLLPALSATSAPAAPAAAATATTSATPAKAKYVFYFIGDGMGMGHVLTAEAYRRSVLGLDDHLLMLRFPAIGFATSHSASSDVTDSAAGGTALATGHKTRNGMIGMDADSVAVESIASRLFSKGWGVGLVTTGSPDDATPAVFYAHQPNRGMSFEIGRDAALSGYQFIAGSNWRGLRDKNGKSTGLEQIFEENNVTTVRGLDALKGVNAHRIVLLNTDTVESSTIGYTVDSIPGVLTLPGMTQACLDHLEKVTPGNFFMMVEEGDIDHASHANDGGSVVREVNTLQQAVDIAFRFYMQHPDETLIVISADHNTGGLALGNTFQSYCADLKTIDSQRVSKEVFSKWCAKLLADKTPVTWDWMKEQLSDKFGYWRTVKLTDKQSDFIHKEFDSTFTQGDASEHKTLYNTSNNFVEAVFDTFNDIAGIGFTTERHAGDFVPVFAVGVGSERFAGFHDNTDLPKIILQAAGE